MDKKKIIKVSISTLAVLVFMLFCGKYYMYSHGLSGEYANGEVKKGQIKVACIGDSITYGHGVEDWEENNYPAQLQKILGDAYHVANFGSSGACLNPDGDQPYMKRELYQKSLEYDADIIVVMLGTNDSKEDNWVSSDVFVTEYLSFIHNYYNGDLGTNPPKVYIGLCPEAFYTKDADSSEGIAGFHVRPAIIDEIAASMLNGLPECDCALKVNGIIDIHSLTEAHPEWFEADGIHPNAEGAKAIAEAIADALK